ncbi:hypothetical protein OUZ56_004314 [Daphnia magna]|uniref:Uncharacterized protein n=1 Tax=Daphnia magna TaxID=35525 RepID=A0ABQ9YPD7_9CRUS|nr:hypothetical protein OUZ56_004314 [Daphnia magna]
MKHGECVVGPSGAMQSAHTYSHSHRELLLCLPLPLVDDDDYEIPPPNNSQSSDDAIARCRPVAQVASVSDLAK